MAKKIIIALVGAVIILVGFSFISSRDDGQVASETKTEAPKEATLISPERLDSMLKQKDFTFINVHIPYEKEIEGTDLFIPYDEIENEIDFPKDSKIVLYCRSGGMSRVAAQKLVDLGYTNVYDLEGGMIAWERSGRELIDNEISTAYVALGPSDQIAVVDLSGSSGVEVLPAGNNPHGIAVAGEYLFSSSTKMGRKEMIMEPDHDDGVEMDMDMMMKLGSNFITVTDIQTKKVVKTIDVGGGSHHLAATPDGRFVIVTVPSKSGIAVIDVQNLENVNFIETGLVSNYPVVSPDGNRVYVTNKGNDTISVVDLKSESVIANIPVGTRPDHAIVSRDGNFVYVANGGSDDVSVIDANSLKVVLTVEAGETPHGIGVSPDGDKVYVANSEGRSISVIDTESGKILETIKVGSEISHIEITPNGKQILANSESDKSIFVIDVSSGEIERTIDLGKEPHQLTFR